MWKKKRAPIQYILMMDSASMNCGAKEAPAGCIPVQKPSAITVHVEYQGHDDTATEYAPAWDYVEDRYGIAFDYMDTDARLHVRIPWHSIVEVSTRPYCKGDFEDD